MSKIESKKQQVDAALKQLLERPVLVEEPLRSRVLEHNAAEIAEAKVAGADLIFAFLPYSSPLKLPELFIVDVSEDSLSVYWEWESPATIVSVKEATSNEELLQV